MELKKFKKLNFLKFLPVKYKVFDAVFRLYFRQIFCFWLILVKILKIYIKVQKKNLFAKKSKKTYFINGRQNLVFLVQNYNLNCLLVVTRFDLVLNFEKNILVRQDVSHVQNFRIFNINPIFPIKFFYHRARKTASNQILSKLNFVTIF